MFEEPVQCLECFHIKKNGAWRDQGLKHLIHAKHVYCEKCEQKIIQSLRAVREFKIWSLEEQLQFLRHELQQERKHDRLSLQSKLKFYGVEEIDFDLYCEELQDLLVEKICHLCFGEMEADSIDAFGGFPAHSHCLQRLEEKLDRIQAENWDLTGKLDAYLDMFSIEKNIRPEVKRILRLRRENLAPH